MRLMQEIAYPQPSRLKSWTDTGGTAWRRIGNEPLDKKAVRRLIEDPGDRGALLVPVSPPRDRVTALHFRHATG
jgi:hypothetical protein